MKQQSLQLDDFAQNQQQEDQQTSFAEFLARLQEFKTRVFSGSLIIEANNDLSWIFYFRLGRLSWVAGGANPDERWKRHLAIFGPDVDNTDLEKLENIVLQQELYHHYRILGLLHNQKLIQRQQLVSLITSVAIEVVFDVIQYCQTSGENLSYKTSPDNLNSKLGILLPLVKTEEVINSAIQAWQKWQTAGLAAYSPNLFPVIQQPEILQKQISASRERAIISLLDGKETLRSLALKSSRDLIALSSQLIRLVNSGALALSEVLIKRKIDSAPDEGKLASVGNNVVVAPSGQSPLVACVDDNPTLSQAVEQMDKDGLVEGMRAKLVGSNDFLSKLVEAPHWLKMFDKHLKRK
ncbi:MAG: hypothetical protein QNJ54_29290 [Prochloraceae cyanobacterium]|nr:hypothetical protein [Prochloraceae cyanobacterium]